MASPSEYLEQLAAGHPELAETLQKLNDYYTRKLWHQLTLELENLWLTLSDDKTGLLIGLYQNFVSSFGHKLNLLKLAKLASKVAKTYTDLAAGMAFLEQEVQKLEGLKHMNVAEPILYLQMHVSEMKLHLGKLQESKKMFEAGNETLDQLADVDPSVSASVHFVRCLYFKFVRDFTEFYRSALMYLCFVSSDDLPQDFKQQLAVDVSLAALLGEDIYNFGELLLHPIVKVLTETGYTWLYELLHCFNQGDMELYDQLCVKYADVLNGQPALVEHERRLRQKITILSLITLISRTPAEERKIPLSTIAARTKLDTDGVEFLLMKTMSLHLIEGVIDEVEGFVQVSWVQPRVLTLPQVTALSERLNGWIGKVQEARTLLENSGVSDLEVY